MVTPASPERCCHLPLLMLFLLESGHSIGLEGRGGIDVSPVSLVLQGSKAIYAGSRVKPSQGKANYGRQVPSVQLDLPSIRAGQAGSGMLGSPRPQLTQLWSVA